MTTSISCPSFSSNLDLYKSNLEGITSRHGKIEKEPLFSQPQILEELLNLGDLAFPIYIIPFRNLTSSNYEKLIPREFCVYPVTIPLKTDSEHFLSQSTFESVDPSHLSFGSQTHIYSLEKEIGYIITQDQKVYAKNLYDGIWYFLGNPKVLYGYLDSFFYFVNWMQKNKDNFSFLNPSYFQTNSSSTLLTAPTNAEENLSLFFKFLRKTEPDLSKQIHNITHHLPFLHDPFFKSSCGKELLKEAYAYVDSVTHGIYFLEKTFQLLNKKEYQAAAIILSHEVRHKKSYDEYIIFPSDQLISSAINFFYESTLSENLLFEKLTTEIKNELYCQLLPTTPEDEITSHLDELIYINQKKETLSTEDRRVLAENFQLLNDYLNGLLQFPPGLLSISTQYYLRLLDQKSNESPAAKSITNFLKNDFNSRLAKRKNLFYQSLPFSKDFQDFMQLYD